MISVAEALDHIRQHARPVATELVKLHETLGRVLGADITSDIDSPPHDKSLVDGFAVIAQDVATAGAELRVLELVTAGNVPTKSVTRGTSTRIMTGAPVPDGADAVVMVEHTELLSDERVRVLRAGMEAGQNILRRAASMKKNECVLHAGTYVRPIELGLLAEVGRSEVLVYTLPSLAVISTGDELVAHDEVPSAGQIRNSNGPMLVAMAKRAEARPVDLGIVRDKPELLRAVIEKGLESDVVVLSGGVSAGLLDLVPKILIELGVKQVFHHVNLKPGKPLWFGVQDRSRNPRLVFGLPGNPVSSLVCFELFVRPALQLMSGRRPVSTRLHAALAHPYSHRGDRDTYFPAVLESDESVRTLAWKGSADLRTLAEANALAYFPAGEKKYAAGERIEVHLFA